VGGLILVLLLVCCGALLEGGPGRGVWWFAGLCLVGAAPAYSCFVSGRWPGIEVRLEKLKRWARRHEESPAQRDARHWRRSEVVAQKLQHQKQEVKALTDLSVGRRLKELETQERWRAQAEYSEFRDVWRTLLGDADMPEAVRLTCREWLARYPEMLGPLVRNAMQMARPRTKEPPGNWVMRETRKHWIH